MSHVYRSGYTRPHALSVAAMVNMLLRFLLVLAIISGTSFAVKEQQKVIAAVLMQFQIVILINFT